MTKTSPFQIEVFLSILASSAKGLKFYKQEKNIEYIIFTFYLIVFVMASLLP